MAIRSPFDVTGERLRSPFKERLVVLSTIALALVLASLLAIGAAVILTHPRAPGPDVAGLAPWNELDRRWGTYLSEREWGTPREDVNGNGWGRTWMTRIERGIPLLR